MCLVYGVPATFGSYDLPNIIILNTRRDSIDEVVDTFIHELIHLQVEEEVVSKKLSHEEKEQLVEKLFHKFK